MHWRRLAGQGQVWKRWSLGSVAQLLDGYPADEPGRQDMLRCIHIALLCVQGDPAARPVMSSVVMMLSSDTVTLQRPSKPGFFARNNQG